MIHAWKARLAALSGAGAVAVLLIVPAAAGDPAKATKAEDPVIGSRTDKPDGSSAISVGRKLPTDWDTKVGVDFGLAAPLSPTLTPEAYLDGVKRDRSSGVGWASVMVPAAPLGWDKAGIEARIDPNQDQGKLTTTLSRPLGENVRVTVKSGAAVTEPLTRPLTPTNPGATAPVQSLATENVLSLDLLDSATTLAAGAKLSTTDDKWLRTLSAEQKLFGGPVSVTGAISERADGLLDRSVKAGFKHAW